MKFLNTKAFSRQKTIHILLWLIGLVYFALIYFLLTWSKIDNQIVLVDALISTICLIGCGYLQFTSLKFYLPSNNTAWKLLSVVITFTVIDTLLTKYIILQFYSFQEISYFDFSIPYRLVVNFLVFLCIIIIIVFWNIQEESEENIRRKEETEKMLRDAELYNLRQQLQPHFLFNSLNSIIALIDFKPDLAKKMSFQLSDFLRGTLRKDEKQLIPLEDEIKHLKLYLDIESVRFGHRLKTQIKTDDIASGLNIVPAMILQPLLENAIKFGLYNVTGDVEIKVEINRMADLLHIKISNPFDKEQYDYKRGTGFGLRSIQRRLHLLYGRTDLLENSIEDDYYTCTIKIPQND